MTRTRRSPGVCGRRSRIHRRDEGAGDARGHSRDRDAAGGGDGANAREGRAGEARAPRRGAVRIITRDCRTGTARRAEYHDLEQRVVLLGNARVWQEDNVVSGETITIFLSQDRSVVQGGRQERVKAVFYQKDDKQKDDKAKDGETTAAVRPAPATCEN